MKSFDLQVNGYAGVDFCAQQLPEGELERACLAMREDGFDRFLATLITDSIESLCAKLRNLTAQREASPIASQMIAGFHVEGPFMSPEPGFAGAHPPECMRPFSLDDTRRLQDAAGGLIRLMTIAPERVDNFTDLETAVDMGIAFSAGHCNPTLDQLHQSIDYGLSLVTHFGNGCPVELPRHDNILQRFLAFRDDLWFCFIPDGAHVEFFALRNYIDFVGVDRTIIVTDATAPARMGPGIHSLSGMQVEVDEQGISRRPGSPNLAGSTVSMNRAIENIRHHCELSTEQLAAVFEQNPRIALDR